MSLNREQPMRPFLDELADAFEAYEVPDNSIGASNIIDGSITTPKIADGAVNMDKLASDVLIPQPTDAQVTSAVNTWLTTHPEATTTVQDGAVTTAKIAGGAVTDAKLAQTGGLLTSIRDYATSTITLESGTFNDSTAEKVSSTTRVRTETPIPIAHISSITAPAGYTMWVLERDRNKNFIRAYNSWQPTMKMDALQSDVYYIDFAIKDASSASANLTSLVDTIQAGMQVEMAWDALSDELETAFTDFENVTDNYMLTQGQAYGTVGSTITLTTTGWYQHARIADGDATHVFFRIGANTVSSYVQYVDDNDTIIALDVTLAQINAGMLYTYGQEVLYELDFPSGATAAYVTSNGNYTNAYGVFKILKSMGVMSAAEMAMRFKTINSEIDGLQKHAALTIPNYDSVCRSVCRIAEGFSSTPVQSVAGYKAAYKAGFRIMLCDLRFTSDNVPVLWHDDYLNQFQNVVYKNGELVSTDNPVYIADTTYAELQTYDFGVYRGSAYEGTKIMTLGEMLDLCKRLGCEVYLEEKVNPVDVQFDVVFDLIRKYGMYDRVTWCPQSVTQLNTLVNYEPNVYIQLHTNLSNGSSLASATVNALVECINDYNKEHVSLTVQQNAILTQEVATLMSENGIGLMGTTLETESQVLAYYAKGAPYTMISEALSSGVVAGKILLENALN